MNEEGNIYRMGLVPIVGEFNLVATPSLIKVQSIKKKMVDQMPETPLKMLADAGDVEFRVLGRVGPYVVFHSDSHQFSKIHRNDFEDYHMGIAIRKLPVEERPDSNKLHEEAYAVFNKIPMMFEA